MKRYVTFISHCIIPYEIIYLLCSTKCINTMLTNVYKMIIWCPFSVLHWCAWQHKMLDNSKWNSPLTKCSKNSSTYRTRFQLLFMEVAAKASSVIELLHAFFCHSLSFSLPLLFLAASSLLTAFFIWYYQLQIWKWSNCCSLTNSLNFFL